MTREPLPDDLAAIRRAAAALDDPHAALNQHLHGDGDSTISDDEIQRLRSISGYTPAAAAAGPNCPGRDPTWRGWCADALIEGAR